MQPIIKYLFNPSKRLLISLLIIIGFALFLGSLSSGFVWDDEEQILNNNLVHSISNLPSFFSGSTFNTGGSGALLGMYYKPLMSVCFAVIYSVFGPNPSPFHLFQLLLHLTNTVLVFLLFYYLLAGNGGQIKSRATSWTAFLLAVVFLVHPINVESVVYISALQDVLFFFFGVLAFYFLGDKNSDLKSFLLPSFLLLCSVLSKETGFIFFIIFFFYYILFNRRSIKIYLISSGIVLSICVVLRFFIAKVFFAKQDFSPIMRADFADRLLTIPKIIFIYLKTVFFPKDLIIAQHWVVTSPNWNEFILPLIAVLAFFASLILIAFYIYKKCPEYFRTYLFFFLWFVSGLALHLQLFPLDMTLAERWFYLPFVGLLGMLGVLVLCLKSKIRLVLLIFFIIVFPCLSFRTFLRTQDWKSGLTLYAKDIILSPGVFDLENNYGVELFRAGKITEAKIHFERSITAAPQWWTNWNNLGAIVEQEGNFAKAQEYYGKAISNGDYYLAYENYAMILIKQKEYQEAKDFIEQKALARFPYNQRLNELIKYITQISD